MVKLNNINIVHGMLAVLIILQACRDKCSEGERGNPYISMPMVITPGTDSIRLGDTLTVTIEMPFDNLNTRDGNRIDISRSNTSTFGMDHRLINKAVTNDSIYAEGLECFKIIYERGGGVQSTNVAKRNSFANGADRFIFRAKVIPLKKGVVNLVNYRAEGEMEKGCVLVDFTPVCVDAVRSHKAYFRYLGIPYDPTFSSLYPNHYYVVVK